MDEELAQTGYPTGRSGDMVNSAARPLGRAARLDQ
jgi:hypothetical protein